MSGIVGRDDEGKYVTSNVTVVFEFYLPYMTKSSQSLTFIIRTSPILSLNGLVGLPWIQKVGAIFDHVNIVIECKLLDVDLFPVTSMRAQFSVPEVSRPSQALHKHTKPFTQTWKFFNLRLVYRDALCYQVIAQYILPAT